MMERYLVREQLGCLQAEDGSRLVTESEDIDTSSWPVILIG